MNEQYQPIEELLIHRFPFLYVDKLTEVNEETIVGTRYFGPNEPFFQGHFPEYPVVPGVILIETMAQCGGAGLRQLEILKKGVLFVLGTVEKAKFRQQVRPGDTARIEVKNLRISQRVIKQSGKIFVGDVLAAEATWMCVLSEQSVEES